MIITRTPFRVSLLGGGTDYPEWVREHGGAVIGSSIDKHCYLTCRNLPPFFEHRIRIVYSKIENCASIDEIQHPAVREVLRHLDFGNGIEIHHDGDLPARSGMGSSSSFTVGLLHAVHALEGRTVSKHQLALESIHLEQSKMKECVGSQDQVLSSHGGFNHVVFQPDGEIKVNPMPLSPERLVRLNDRLLLFFTGINRTAAKVARSITENIATREKPLWRMRSLVDQGLDLLNRDGDDLSGIGDLLHESWSLKKEMSPLVSNPLVDDIYESARAAGALGGKLLGAGGGGFLLFFVEPEKRDAVLTSLSSLIHVPFRFESEGSQVIFTDPRENYESTEKRRKTQRIRPFREMNEPGAETKRDLYRRMQLIRKVELAVEKEYATDEMVTPVHLCIGQEAVAVGACAPMRKDDYISSNFRGHGHYLAKGGDLKAFMAELYCRSTGCARGFGGSMHLVDPSVGHLGSSAIVGGGIPIGVGLALSARMQNLDRVSVVFFGDGAVEEGVFHESVNFAMLRKLPVVFVLENNQWSINSPIRNRQVAPTLFHKADPEHLGSCRVDGNDVLKVREAVGEAVERARGGGGPSLVECATYRMRQHVGPGSDVHLGHRTAEELAEWVRRCPVESFRVRLIREGTLDEPTVRKIDAEIDSEIQAAISFAKESPLTEGHEVTDHLFRK